MEGPHSAKTEDLPKYPYQERQVDFTMVRPKKAVNIKDGYYYVYLRKSRKDIEREMYGDMETLARHEADLDDFCSSGGYPIAGKFKELVSGESISARHEFRKLMDMVAQRKVTGIVVHAVDRLGRGDVYEYGWVLSTLQYTRTLVITPGKVYDPTDPADFLALQMLMIISSGELSNTKGRFRDGKNRSAKNGEWVPSVAPYGYDKVDVNRQHTLVENDKAEVVRFIFRSMADYKGTFLIANMLNDSGIATPTGKGLWDPSTVLRVIRNPAYKGRVVWGRTRVEIDSREGFDVSKKPVAQEEKDIIDVPGLHKPIVSEELWQAANDAVRPAPKVKTQTELFNPFAGMLFCRKCGQVVRISGEDKRWVKEGEHGPRRFMHFKIADCERWKSFRVEVLCDMVFDALMQIAGDMELQAKQGVDKAAEARAAELEALTKERASLLSKKDRLVELYMNEDIEIEAYRARKSGIEAQLEKMEARISELEKVKVVNLMELSMTTREVAAVLKDPSANARKKNDMLRKIVKKILVENRATKQGENDLVVDIILL